MGRRGCIGRAQRVSSSISHYNGRYICQNRRMHNAESEHQCKLWSSGGHDVSAASWVVTDVPLGGDVDREGLCRARGHTGAPHTAHSTLL